MARFGSGDQPTTILKQDINSQPVPHPNAVPEPVISEAAKKVDMPLGQTSKVEHKGPVAGKKPNKLRMIRKAKWGCDGPGMGLWKDVTDVVAHLALLNNFEVTNVNIGCDPCFGIRKQLVLTMDNGQEKVFLEGETCDLKAIENSEGLSLAGNKINLSKFLDELKTQNHVMYEEFFERNCLGTLSKHVEGRRIIDIGANYGFFGLQSRSLGSLSVLAVEPDEHNFSVLTKNSIGMDITPIRCAVMQHGVRRVRLIDSRGISKALPDADGTIEARTLHEVIAWMPPDDDDMVLKIDVEGGEYDILMGASGQDLRRFAYMFVDTHQVPHLENRQGRTAAFLEEYLGLLGFKVEERKNIYNWGAETYAAIPNQHSWILRRD